MTARGADDQGGRRPAGHVAPDRRAVLAAMLGGLPVGASSLGGSPRSGDPARGVRVAELGGDGLALLTDFGVSGDGTGDAGAALQAAHDALGPDGGVIVVPPASSFYRQTTPARFTKPVLLRGGGWRSAELRTEVAGLVCVSTNNWLGVDGIEFGAGGAAAGSAVFVHGSRSSRDHGDSRFVACRFVGGRHCVWLQRANQVHFTDCQFSGYRASAVLLENLVDPDEGDSFLANCVFSGGTGDEASALVLRNAGAYWSNGKINGRHRAAVRIDASEGDIGNFTFTGGSMEGHAEAAIRVEGDDRFVCTKLLVTGVQFSSEAVAHVVLAGRARNVVITGCVFNGVTGRTGTAILGGSECRDVTLSGNQFHRIRTAMRFAASPNAGLTVHGNRFADDVAVLFAGEDAADPNGQASSKTITASRLVDASAGGAWADAYRWRGSGSARLRVSGLVQGVGPVLYAGEIAFMGAERAALGAPVALGPSMEVRVTGSGGDNVLQVRKHPSAGGTALSAMVEVEWSGYPTEVARSA